MLPALLSWLGDRVDKGRIPFLGRRRAAAAPSKVWSALVRRVVRRPQLWGGAATVVILAIAAPALGIRLAYPAIDAPQDLPVVSTIEAIQAAFPQSPAPAEVVITGQHLTGPAVTSAISKLESLAATGGPIREPVTATSVADGRALIVSVPLAGNGGDSASYAALDALRDRILPQTFGGTGVTYAVTGDTAANHDNAGQLSARTPLVLAVVAAVAFCLLLLSFRSVVLPLVSIALNFLSVAAAYGLITVIFQDGRLQGLLGYASSGAITPWVPLFLFTFLFGISMDYHVFIVSRIGESRRRGETTACAVTTGIASSAGVVSSAALIMVAVFSIFIGMGQVELKMLGVGLAAAIALDATIVRGVLLPAAMTLLGDRCWYLPRWLSWLPGRTSADPGTTKSGATASEPPRPRRELGDRVRRPAPTTAGTGRPGAPSGPGEASPWSGSPWSASGCGWRSRQRSRSPRLASGCRRSPSRCGPSAGWRPGSGACPATGAVSPSVTRTAASRPVAMDKRRASGHGSAS